MHLPPLLLAGSSRPPARAVPFLAEPPFGLQQHTHTCSHTQIIHSQCSLLTAPPTTSARVLNMSIHGKGAPGGRG